MLSAAWEHPACHAQAEEEDVLEQADKDHAADLLFPFHREKVLEHPPAAAAAAEAEVPGLFWDDEDGMVAYLWDCDDDNTDDDMAPEEHNEAKPEQVSIRWSFSVVRVFLERRRSCSSDVCAKQTCDPLTCSLPPWETHTQHWASPSAHRTLQELAFTAFRPWWRPNLDTTARTSNPATPER